MPKLKTEQEWFIGEIANQLVSVLKLFFNIVPENRLADGVKIECQKQLARLSPLLIPISFNAST
jgi:hypothetical protein